MCVCMCVYTIVLVIFFAIMTKVLLVLPCNNLIHVHTVYLHTYMFYLYLIDNLRTKRAYYVHTASTPRASPNRAFIVHFVNTW